MNKIQLYEEVDAQECWGKTGKAPISTTWVGLNKGTQKAPDVGFRIVARDFKPKGQKDRGDLFAAMPPVEAKRLPFQKAVRENARRRQERRPGRNQSDARRCKESAPEWRVAGTRACVHRAPRRSGPRGKLWSLEGALVWDETSSKRVVTILQRGVGQAWFPQGSRRTYCVLRREITRSLCCSWRRF